VNAHNNNKIANAIESISSVGSACMTAVRPARGAAKLGALLATGALLASQLAGGQPTQAQAGGNYTYFPTASTTDARMLGLSGRPAITLAGETIRIRLETPANLNTFELGLFDGDTGKDNAGNINATAGNWDSGSAELEYSVFADPEGDGVPGTLVARWLGNSPNPLSGPNYTASSATMPNNAWWSAQVTNAPTAQAADGSFVYLLVVRLTDPASATSSNFKLRVSGKLALYPGNFSTIPAAYTDSDYRIVYPAWDGTQPPAGSNFWQTTATTFDGTFDYLLQVPAGLTALELWDGDYDHGSAQLTATPSGLPIANTKDTDDANTPNGIPQFAAGTAAIAEAAQGVGNPPDDNFRDWLRRSPAVRYEVVAPNGQVFSNENPSGNLEWERFVIAAQGAPEAATADHVVAASTLPAGVWRMRVNGLDLDNLTFQRFPVLLLGQDEGGEPPAEVPSQCGKVTGGGWIPLQASSRGNNNKGTFSVHAMCDKNGAVKGNLNYVDHVRKLHIKATSITSLVVNGTHATITGRATIDGKGDFGFVVEVDDLGEPGSSDKFWISLSNGYSAGSTTMGGGNIQIHK